MNRFKVYRPLLAVVISVAGFIAYSLFFAADRTNLSPSASSDTASPLVDVYQDSNTQDSNVVDSSNDEYADEELVEQQAKFKQLLETTSLARILGYEQWAVARGWGDRPYQTYDVTTLEKLSESGDGRASQELARRVALGDPARALYLFDLAAERGFSSSLVMAGQVHWRFATKESDPLKQTRHYVDAYSSALTGQMRNDPSAFALAFQLEQEYDFSSHDIAAACKQANEKYIDLSNRRSSAGVAPFDNSPPSLTNRHLDRAGQACGSWPVERPKCQLVPLNDSLNRIEMFKCRFESKESQF